MIEGLKIFMERLTPEIQSTIANDDDDDEENNFISNVEDSDEADNDY